MRSSGRRRDPPARPRQAHPVPARGAVCLPQGRVGADLPGLGPGPRRLCSFCLPTGRRKRASGTTATTSTWGTRNTSPAMGMTSPSSGATRSSMVDRLVRPAPTRGARSWRSPLPRVGDARLLHRHAWAVPRGVAVRALR